MANDPYGKPVEILLVEDSPSDIHLTRRALADSKVRNRLHVVTDGVQAMRFLRREDEYAEAPQPDIILLDLNMPRKNGREVLAEIKADPQLAVIPVVVLTTSEAEKDVCESYRLHANCYMIKPVDFHQFMDVIRSIEDFWLTFVKLPHTPGRKEHAA